MRRFGLLAFLVASALIIAIAADTADMSSRAIDGAVATLHSPDGELALTVRLDDQASLRWQLDRRGGALVEDSALTVSFGDVAFGSALVVDASDSVIAETFAVSRPTGKQRNAQAPANRQTLVVTNSDGHRIGLDLVAFDDAVAHRFRQLDALGHGTDSTSFVFSTEATKYVQAYDRVAQYQPASEALYSDAVPIDFTMPALDGWSLPALFDTPSGWVLLGETAVGPYADGSRLTNGGQREHVLSPPIEDQGQGPIIEEAAEPFALPWKVMVAGDLDDVISSNAFELLATPTTMTDTDWIAPGRVSWSWWSDSDSPRDPERLREFIDFGAEVGWEYTLIDANWNLMPDGTIEDLIAYGAERNVGIFLWYNSGGAHNVVTEQPRDRMDDRARRREEMAWLSSLGVVGLKVDFFQSDRASMNRMSLELLEDAAEFGLLMNFHGITSPKGWHATWPHLMTTEAVRGAEQYKFDPFFPQTAPRHHTVLPFTRNAVGPMDYTPMTMTDLAFPHATTSAHEMALGIIFESALQHPADSPESYRSLGEPGMDYLRTLPSVWDEVRLLAGTPGDYVVLARRHDDQWWIGGINGRERPTQVTVDLGALGDGFRIGRDGGGRDDIDFDREQGTVSITMESFGGFFAWPATS